MSDEQVAVLVRGIKGAAEADKATDRDKTGVGLAEAKNAVEALARANGLPGGEPSAGCGGAALLALTVLVGAIGYLVTRLA